MCLGILANQDKIGNLMILLAERINPLYHTKLIKLLYLIDESAIKDSGVPITWLDYQLWQYGPVAPESFYIKGDNNIFGKFISTEKTQFGSIVKSNIPFDNKQFSEYEMSIIDMIINKYGRMSAEELVNITHEKDSLWSITKEENDEDFEIANTTPIILDLKRLIDDKIKLQNYEGAEETMYFNASVEGSLAS